MTERVAPARRTVDRVRRRLRRHRRPASAVALAVAAGLGVNAAAAEPPAGVAVLVAGADLPAGHVLASSDLTTASVPDDVVPDGVLEAGEAVGRPLASPVRRGEVLTDARLTGATQLVAAPPGTVAVNVPLSDVGSAALVGPGDAVRVIAGSTAGDGFDPRSGEGARVLVDRAVVLRASSAASPGLLSDSTAGPSVVLAMSTDEAVRIADAVNRRWVGVAVLP